MPVMNIARGAAAPKLRRGDVAPGMVFAVKGGNKRYAAIGQNGRLYSANIDTGELASSANEDSEVTVIGKWKFNLDRTYRHGSRIGREVLRSEVKPHEVFMVKGGTREYAHIGRISRDKNGWLSVPLDNTDNHAVTRNGDSHVTVVGTYKMDVTLSK